MNIDDYIRDNRTEDGFDESKQLAPPTPTTSLRGSPERVEVYRQRIERGEQLFCEADSRNGMVAKNERLFSYKAGRRIVKVRRGASK